jgi:TonB family protein
MSWTEALAIAQEVAECAADAPGGNIPAFGDILISSVGSVSLLPGPQPADGPVPRFAQLLRALVPDDRPAPLRLAISQIAHEDARFRTLGDCVKTLAYFEQPGRAELIRDVFQRWRALPALTRPTSEPEKPARPARKATDERKPKRRRWNRKVLAAIGLCAAAVALVAVWILQGESVSARSRVAELRGLVTTLRETVAAHLPTGIPWLSNEVAPGAEDASASAETDADPSRPPASAGGERVPDTGAPIRSTVPDVTVDAREPEASSAAGRPGSTASGPGGGSASPAGGPEALRSSAVAGNVMAAGPVAAGGAASPGGTEPALATFSAADLDVTPPVMIRPQLPSTPPPGVSIEGLPVVEILVSEGGEVDSVRLVSGGRGVHDTMMLSAIKTWRFQPAMKDGRPARYRLRMWLTQP